MARKKISYGMQKVSEEMGNVAMDGFNSIGELLTTQYGRPITEPGDYYAKISRVEPTKAGGYVVIFTPFEDEQLTSAYSSVRFFINEKSANFQAYQSFLDIFADIADFQKIIGQLVAVSIEEQRGFWSVTDIWLPEV